VQRVPGGREGELPAAGTVAEYSSGGRNVIGAYAPAGPWGFGVVVDRTVDAALVPVNQIRRATLFWIGVSGIIASMVARAFARRLADRVEVLAGGSRAIAAGNLETRMQVDANDELGDLAMAFNKMASSLDAARTKIVQQTKEIMAWNETLERRVEDKTKELRQAQDLLLRSRSLAALGELGAGVAHEINNPLAGVLGIAQLVLADLPPAHPVRPLMQDVETQAMRIRHIVQNLLRFAQRQGGEDFAPVDLAHVLDDAIELCSPSDLAASGIRVVRRYAEGLPAVRGSATQLQQVFIQLIRNSRAAMKDGGTLTLETSAPDEKLVRVRIGDTGRGITPEHLPRVFDPFFTTKSEAKPGEGDPGDGGHVGMGLSVVHKTVEDHGGAVQVQSEIGRGTTFEMTFPVDTGRALRA
jgi:two-component system NtrC family sensor kinase